MFSYSSLLTVYDPAHVIGNTPQTAVASFLQKGGCDSWTI
jgi:hypothetical protein